MQIGAGSDRLENKGYRSKELCAIAVNSKPWPDLRDAGSCDSNGWSLLLDAVRKLFNDGVGQDLFRNALHLRVGGACI